MPRLDCCSLPRAVMMQLRNSGEFDPEEDMVVRHIIESRDEKKHNKPINVTINININKK